MYVPAFENPTDLSSLSTYGIIKCVVCSHYRSRKSRPKNKQLPAERRRFESAAVMFVLNFGPSQGSGFLGSTTAENNGVIL